MTDKLYYKDAYIKDFEATVLSVSRTDDMYDVVLDRTAFFPEEGGQSADHGFIGNSRVVDAKEKNGVIHHFCDTPPAVGATLGCKIDFEERFEKMQCHTAEHIICGLIHKRFGYENVGFHLGESEVVFDVSAPMTRAELDEISVLANRAVYENRPISTYFPSKEELTSLEYRSKLDISENVRIVNIEGYDSCACCAPHVNFTGEIGSIAILDFEKHRGGTRIYMLAGKRAEADYRERYNIIRKISALTSEPQKTVDTAVEKLLSDIEALKSELKLALQREAVLRAELLTPTEGNAVVLIENFTIPDLIEFSNHALPRVDGILVALSGSEGNYKYVISSRTKDLRALSKEINSALSGRGGGRPEMIQGAFVASLSEIKAYFK